MKRKYVTDEEVEKEIDELKDSPYVKLARRENYLRNKCRQHLYKLRSLEKRGRELASAGITLDTIDEQIELLEKDETTE